MAVEWKMVEENVECELSSDASAALSIAKRQAAGKMRHINVRSLWLQEKSQQKDLKYSKVKGENNPADGLTKHVRQELAQQYERRTFMRLSSDRARSSLKLA